MSLNMQAITGLIDNALAQAGPCPDQKARITLALELNEIAGAIGESLLDDMCGDEDRAPPARQA